MKVIENVENIKKKKKSRPILYRLVTHYWISIQLNNGSGVDPIDKDYLIVSIRWESESQQQEEE